MAAAAAAATPTAANARPELQLPPREEIGSWLAALVRRDGTDVVARALIGSCPRNDLMAITEILCNSLFGPEPRDGLGVRC